MNDCARAPTGGSALNGVCKQPGNLYFRSLYPLGYARSLASNKYRELQDCVKLIGQVDPTLGFEGTLMQHSSPLAFSTRQIFEETKISRMHHLECSETGTFSTNEAQNGS